MDTHYVLLGLLFFVLGTVNDYLYAKWTIDVVRAKWRATLWALGWAYINIFFVLTIADKQDWVLGTCYAFGITFGTALMIIEEKREQRNTFYKITYVNEKRFIDE